MQNEATAHKEVLTPEIDKMKSVNPQSQAIGEFLVWLQEFKGVSMVHTIEEEDDCEKEVPYYFSIEKLLAEYFEIDLKKVEEEKLAILEQFNKANVP